MGGGSTLNTYLVDRLINKDIAVRCLIKDRTKALAMPFEIECTLGSPDNHASLEAFFRHADVALIYLPPSYNEARHGINALEVAKNSGVKKIVYLSSMMPWNSRHLPLFRNKVRIEEALRGLTIPYTILRPNFFFQSLLYFEREIMKQGTYPFPIGCNGVSQVDLRDVAEAAFNALTMADYNWKEYAICGPEALSGDDLSAILSDVLGKEIIYGGNDIRSWKEIAETFMPGAIVEEWTKIFGFIQRGGLFPDADDMIKQREILRGAPLSFRDFAEELAMIWKSREAAGLKTRVRQEKLYRAPSRRARSVPYQQRHI